jgi:heme oxygenase
MGQGAAPSAPASGVLRAETSRQHAATEQTIDWSHALSSRDGYAQLLRRMLCVTAPLEAAIERRLGADLGGIHVSREFSQWLRNDLRRLGVEEGKCPDAQETADAVVNSHAGAAGALYVLEGSTLGGQVIGRQLKDKLGLGPSNGACYYHGRGEQTGAHWVKFKAWLDEAVQAPAEVHEAVAAAQRTFDLFTRALGGEFDG